MEFRESIFSSIVDRVRLLVQDVNNEHKLTREELIKEIKHALEGSTTIKGIVSSHRLTVTFKPFSTDLSLVDKDIYENIVNMVVNYGLSRDVGSGTSLIETKALNVNDMQVALVKVHFNVKGTSGGVPTMDISLDKDPEAGENLTGSWLVAEDRISAIVTNKEIDLSGIPSPSFALRWSIADPSDYKVLDTVVDLMLVNSSMLIENMVDIQLLASSNILRREAIAAKKRGQIEYGESLEVTAKNYLDEVRGRQGSGVTPTVGVGGFGHNIDRNSRVAKAFGGGKEGTFISIVGTTITGKRIRHII